MAILLQERQKGPPSLAPPGVVPNYINPSSLAYQVIVTSMVLIVFSITFVVVRLLVKWRVVKKWGLDDC